MVPAAESNQQVKWKIVSSPLGLWCLHASIVCVCVCHTQQAREVSLLACDWMMGKLNGPILRFGAEWKVRRCKYFTSLILAIKIWVCAIISEVYNLSNQHFSKIYLIQNRFLPLCETVFILILPYKCFIIIYNK